VAGTRLALTELSAVRAEPASEYRLVLSGGKPLPPGVKVTDRGSRLHFLTGTSWYRLIWRISRDDRTPEPGGGDRRYFRRDTG
jgi:hypothetical protein